MRQTNFHPSSILYLVIAVIVLMVALTSCYPVQQGSKGCILANRAGDTGRTFKMKH